MADQEMDPLSQLQDLWQHAIPAPQLKRMMEDLQTPNKRSKGKGKGKTQQKESPHLETLVLMMGKLLMRHEDAINALMTEHQFVLYLTLGQGSVVPHLLRESKAWRDQTTKEGPLRQKLAISFIKETQNRLNEVEQKIDQKGVLDTLIQTGILDQHRNLPYLTWDKAAKRLVPNKQPAIPLAQIKDLLDHLLIMLADVDTTVRFHSMKPMEKAVQSTDQQSLAFVWMVSNQTHREVWHKLRSTCWNSIWLLANAQLKPHTLGRCNLAQQIQKQGLAM